MDDFKIYNGRSFGSKLWACSNWPTCDAYVGCHPGPGHAPLGRLANKELRDAKMAAHTAFDRLWNLKIKRERCSKRRARTAGYRWLAAALGIPPRDCHIGMFDVGQCLQVVEVCGRKRTHRIAEQATTVAQ